MNQVSIGRIVLLVLSAAQAEDVNRRRAKSAALRIRIHETAPAPPGSGAQAHVGNAVKEGDVFPMVIVRAWGTTPGSAVNGQVLLDGNDTFWATSVVEGTQPGQWQWPPRVGGAEVATDTQVSAGGVRTVQK